MSLNEKIQDKYGISRSSAQLYIRNYNTLKKELTDDEMKDVAKLKEAISHIKPATQRTYVMGVMRVFGAKDDITKDEMDKLGKLYVDITKELNDDRKSKEQTAPSINFDKKIKKINAMINDADSEREIANLLQDKLMVLIHSEIPPRRAMDWYDMEIVSEPTDEIIEDPEMKKNYYNMRAFVFKNYKTHKKHGTQVVKPTKRIKRTIRQMLDARGEEIGDYLFENKSGKKMTNPTFNKTLKRVLGVGTNDLRKIYINDKVDTEEVRKAMEIAKKMGHSIQTAEKDYYNSEEPKNERKTVDADT